MKKIAIVIAGLLVVTMSGAIAYADSTGSNDVYFASKQNTVDPSSTDQAKASDEQAQKDQASTADAATKEDGNNKKTAHVKSFASAGGDDGMVDGAP